MMSSETEMKSSVTFIYLFDVEYEALLVLCVVALVTLALLLVLDLKKERERSEEYRVRSDEREMNSRNIINAQKRRLAMAKKDLADKTNRIQRLEEELNLHMTGLGSGLHRPAMRLRWEIN